MLEGGASRGLRLPSDPESPAQAREWRKVISSYVRRVTLKTFQQFENKTLASAIGLADRQTQTLLNQVRDPSRGSEDLELAKEILQGMQSNRIAGVLGTDRTDESRAVFSIVFNVRCEWERMTAEDTRAFTMLKAAFDLDYYAWRDEREAWPFRLDGTDRIKKLRGNGSAQIE